MTVTIPEEDLNKIEEMSKSGHTLQQISDETGYSRSTVWRKVKSLKSSWHDRYVPSMVNDFILGKYSARK